MIRFFMVTINTILLNKEDCFVLKFKSYKFLPPFSTINCRIFLKFSIILLVICCDIATISYHKAAFNWSHDNGTLCSYVAIEEILQWARSGDLTGHSMSKQSEINRPEITSLRQLIGALAVWAVAMSCWRNHVFFCNSTSIGSKTFHNIWT